MGMPYAEVIGDPIGHSKSPMIHEYWLRTLKIEGSYRAAQVTADDLPDYLDKRRRDPDWRGCNVTMPLKRAAVGLMDGLSAAAAAIGSVNTVSRGGGGRLEGTNTDAHGVARALAPVALQNKRVAMIGAGGAARAAAFVLAQAGIAELIVLNRSPDRAEQLLKDFAIPGGAPPLGAIPAADLLINASPLGMLESDALPLDLSNLVQDGAVFDMVYAPVRTRLLVEAEERGLKTIDGLTMLVHQASKAFSIFYGVDSPNPARPELRQLLTS